MPARSRDSHRPPKKSAERCDRRAAPPRVGAPPPGNGRGPADPGVALPFSAPFFGPRGVSRGLRASRGWRRGVEPGPGRGSRAPSRPMGLPRAGNAARRAKRQRAAGGRGRAPGKKRAPAQRRLSPSAPRVLSARPRGEGAAAGAGRRPRKNSPNPSLITMPAKSEILTAPGARERERGRPPPPPPRLRN